MKKSELMQNKQINSTSMVDEKKTNWSNTCNIYCKKKHETANVEPGTSR